MKQLERNEKVAIYLSNIGNMILFIAKVYASIQSRSLAVIASTLDSLLDLLSGFILWFTSYTMSKPNYDKYPIGKNRMQPVVKASFSFNTPKQIFTILLLLMLCYFKSKCYIDISYKVWFAKIY
jgi:divalent metal cation (Fe/Co/Zn/Cd) transporter